MKNNISQLQALSKNKLKNNTIYLYQDHKFIAYQKQESDYLNSIEELQKYKKRIETFEKLNCCKLEEALVINKNSFIYENDYIKTCKTFPVNINNGCYYFEDNKIILDKEKQKKLSMLI